MKGFSSDRHVLILALSLIVTSSLRSQDLKGHLYNWNSGPDNEKSIIKGTTRDLSSFEVIAITLAPGKSFRSASKPGNEQLVIIKEGNVKVTLRNSFDLSPGSISFITAGDVFSIENKQSAPATFYLLQYQPRKPLNNKMESFVMDWKQIPVKTTDKGERREFFDRPTALFERFEMHVTTLNKTDEVSHPPHTHRAEEIVLLISGKVQMQIGDEFFNGDPGAVVFLASEFPHALKNIGNSSCTYFAFQWN